MDNDSDISEYRRTAERDLEDRIKEFEKFLERGKAEPTSERTHAKNTRKNMTENIHVGHRKRLREAAIRDKHLDGFRDTEVLELLLSYFIPQKDTNVIAHRLLDKFGSLIGVLKAQRDELKSVPNMTADAANVIPIVLMTCMRHRTIPVRIRNPYDAAAYFGSVYKGTEMSGTYVACLDNDGRLCGVEKCSGDRGEIIHLPYLFSAALGNGTRRVILLRRVEDAFPKIRDLGEKIAQVSLRLSRVGIKFMDFIIYTDYGYYTLGAPNFGGAQRPQFMFVPLKTKTVTARFIEELFDDKDK